tara:strand:+ start:89 stop:508 length:420 start_codon:yes stop_codon:yes gene_type:complete
MAKPSFLDSDGNDIFANVKSYWDSDNEYSRHEGINFFDSVRASKLSNPSGAAVTIADNLTVNGSLTDGTATLGSGSLTGAVNLTASGTVTGSSLVGSHASTSSSYSPAVPANWSSGAPSNVASALDKIAAAIVALGGTL